MEKNMHAWGDVFVSPTNRQPGFPFVVNMSQPGRNWGGDRNSLYWNKRAKQANADLLSLQVGEKEGRSKLPVNTFDLICTFA